MGLSPGVKRPGSEAESPPSLISSVKNERSSAFSLSRVSIKSTGKILRLLLDMGWWVNGRLFSLVLISALFFHMQLSFKCIICQYSSHKIIINITDL